MDLIGPFFSLLLLAVSSTIVYMIGTKYCQLKLNRRDSGAYYAGLDGFINEDSESSTSSQTYSADQQQQSNIHSPIPVTQSTPVKVYSFSPADLHRHYAFSTDSPRDVIVFIHMQKTGGTTFGKNLIHNLDVRHPCKCEDSTGFLHCPCYASDHKKLHYTVPMQCRVRQWLFSRYTTGWMCGLHADLTEWNECLAAGKADDIEGFHRDRRFLKITILRLPTERYISEYLHVTRGATWARAKLKCNGQSATSEEWPRCYEGDSWEQATLTEFLGCPYNLANNRQTRMLANLSLVNCYDKENLNDTGRKQTMLESAKENLNSLAYFAVHGYPNESQLLFEHTFNIKFSVSLAEGIKPKRLHKSNVYLDTLKPAVKEQVRQTNELDMELYEYARQLFLARVEYVKRLKGIKIEEPQSELSNTTSLEDNKPEPDLKNITAALPDNSTV